MQELLSQFCFEDGLPDGNHCQIVDPDLADSHYAIRGGSTNSRHDDFVFVIRGQPRLEQPSPNGVGIAQAVIDEYRKSGPDAPRILRGPFALVLFDTSKREGLFAVDRLGIEALAWCCQDGLITIGTSTARVAKLAHVTPALSRQALFNFMFSHMIPAPDSIYDDVSKITPGTAIRFSSTGVREHRYWAPMFDGRESSLSSQLREETLPILRRSILRTEPGPRTGTFLSGGLDSSTVTGLLSESQDQTTKAFSVGFGIHEFDEMEFARAASSHFGCDHHIYEVVPSDVVELIPKIASYYDEPFGNSSAVPTFCCARLASSHGVDHLLAGDGGDELMGGNERYVRHQLFEHYFRIPGFVRNTVLAGIARTFDPEHSLFPFQKLSSYVQQAQIPLPERFESWNLVYREGAEKIFSRDLLSEVDPDQIFTHMREVWQSCPSDDLLDRMLWYDWKFTLADNDIRKVSRMCELAGVRVSYPMLDEEFVEHSMRIPSGDKIKGRELRSFFKQTVKDYLPNKIIDKTKHGFGLPFGLWLKTDSALQDLVYGSLDTLSRRQLFAAEFLDRVQEEHKGGHASYYGYAIWDLVMLEQWLQTHGY